MDGSLLKLLRLACTQSDLPIKSGTETDGDKAKAKAKDRFRYKLSAGNTNTSSFDWAAGIRAMKMHIRKRTTRHAVPIQPATLVEPVEQFQQSAATGESSQQSATAQVQQPTPDHTIDEIVAAGGLLRASTPILDVVDMFSVQISVVNLTETSVRTFQILHKSFPDMLKILVSSLNLHSRWHRHLA